jgi:hypothetical protein
MYSCKVYECKLGQTFYIFVHYITISLYALTKQLNQLIVCEERGNFTIFIKNVYVFSIKLKFHFDFPPFSKKKFIFRIYKVFSFKALEGRFRPQEHLNVYKIIASCRTSMLILF